jgi:hypothetical protein
MSQADVLVTVSGGVAHVEVRRPELTVEVRDYDVDGADEDELIWTDESGDRCFRYFVGVEEQAPAR